MRDRPLPSDHVAHVAYIRQSRPDFGLGFRVQVLFFSRPFARKQRARVHIRQLRPDSGLDFRAKALKTC